MWTLQQNVQCVLWLAEYKSVIRVQRRARNEYNINPPTSKSILLWDRTLQANGTLIPKTGKHAKKQVRVYKKLTMCEICLTKPHIHQY